MNQAWRNCGDKLRASKLLKVLLKTAASAKRASAASECPFGETCSLTHAAYLGLPFASAAACAFATMAANPYLS